jgi:outer membrane protein TolC
MRRSRQGLRILFGAMIASIAALAAANPPAAPQPMVLSLPAAVCFALENNPQLAAIRTQRGLAAAGVVVARTYPYNPVLESVVLAANGPASAGITNHVFNEHLATLQLELRRQGRHRQTAAAAVVTRTEWEIAAQEIATSVSVIRAYNTVLYRQKKLQIMEESARLNERIVSQGTRLAQFGQLRPADLILARTELDTTRTQRGQGRTALAVARAELRGLLGNLDDTFVVNGELDTPAPTATQDALVRSALATRADVHAKCAAVVEAESNLRLQMADRYGNPSVGPRFEYNESRATFGGVVLNVPIPVHNTKQGEILQRRAELERAHADLRLAEFQVTHAVQAALTRLAEARKWADEFPAEVLPNLEKARQDMEKLFAQNDPGADVLRVIGVQRNLLLATDAYLEARYELNQSLADLTAAVGDPAIAVGSMSEVRPIDPGARTPAIAPSRP